MNRILKIGLDIHTTNFTICIAEPQLGSDGNFLLSTQTKPDVKLLLDVVNTFKKKFKDDEFDITFGYEAGCLGYSLYKEIENKGYKCIILAPSTMKVEKGGRKIKNDYRDAKEIANCLCNGGYKAVYVPTVLDNAVKEYIRMRDDIKQNLKSIKQQIIAFCTRNGFMYSESRYWTAKHIGWMKNLTFEDEILKETLDEYMVEYNHLDDRISRLDKRIEELSQKEIYVDKVNRLKCFIGIKTHTALSLIVETSDFVRFSKGTDYGAWLGLVPMQHASGDNDSRYGITKSGNRHLRRLLCEAAQAYTRGAAGYKSKDLKQRQSLCSSEIVLYADSSNVRLRKKYQNMIRKGKKHNVAVTAIARELACFIWGMMNDHIEVNVKA